MHLQALHCVRKVLLYGNDVFADDDDDDDDDDAAYENAWKIQRSLFDKYAGKVPSPIRT